MAQIHRHQQSKSNWILVFGRNRRIAANAPSQPEQPRALRGKLKLVQREYKGSAKEFQSVRHTLKKSLQSVKL